MHTITKILLRYLAIAISLIFLLVTGCTDWGSTNVASVTFEQLLADPNHFNGKEITIAGFVFLEFEIIVVSEELNLSE